MTATCFVQEIVYILVHPFCFLLFLLLVPQFESWWDKQLRLSKQKGNKYSFTSQHITVKAQDSFHTYLNCKNSTFVAVAWQLLELFLSLSLPNVSVFIFRLYYYYILYYMNFEILLQSSIFYSDQGILRCVTSAYRRQQTASLN